MGLQAGGRLASIASACSPWRRIRIQHQTLANQHARRKVLTPDRVVDTSPPSTRCTGIGRHTHTAGHGAREGDDVDSIDFCGLEAEADLEAASVAASVAEADAALLEQRPWKGE